MLLEMDRLFALARWISSSTLGPLPATGYEPLTGGSRATIESYGLAPWSLELLLLEDLAPRKMLLIRDPIAQRRPGLGLASTPGRMIYEMPAVIVNQLMPEII